MPPTDKTPDPMTLARELPDLIRTHVPSVWALEVLLLLRRNRPRAFSVHAITQELRAAQPLVAAALGGFERSGLVTQATPGNYAYGPATPLLDQFAATLEDQYKERPVSIINIIVAPPDKLKQLADAFRFGRSPGS